MTSFEKIDVDLNNLFLQPITRISFNMRNGTIIDVDTPLSITDFTALWNTKRNKIKIATGGNSYLYIIKRYVCCYSVYTAAYHCKK